MMQNSSLIEVEILNVIAVTLGFPVYKVSSSFDLVEDFGISPVQFNGLICRLEDRFKISFPYDASSYNSSLRLIEFVTQKLK